MRVAVAALAVSRREWPADEGVSSVVLLSVGRASIALAGMSTSSRRRGRPRTCGERDQQN